jgi:hypothetical protein
MAAFQGLPRAILVAISRASGESYRGVDGTELMAKLNEAGHEPSLVALHNVMDRLRDAGYIDFKAMWGGGDADALQFIRLELPGRQEVEGWPSGATIAAADVEALIQAFEAYAEDPDVPEARRGKAAEAARAARDLGVEVAGNVVASWLRSIGVG